MAYDASNEIQREITLISKNDKGDYIRVSNIKKKGSSSDRISYDIRTMYTNKDTDEVLPTQRGIRVDSEVYPRLVAEMVKGMSFDELEEFFDYLTPDEIAQKSTSIHMADNNNKTAVANYYDAVYVLVNGLLNTLDLDDDLDNECDE